jgi:hypothetical protein
MIEVKIIEKPLGFMKRIPSPNHDWQPRWMNSAEEGIFKNYKIFLASENGKNVGWAILFWIKNRKVPSFSIWISSNCRGKGVGKIIFKRATRFSKNMTVFIHDDVSTKFYKSMKNKFKVKLRNGYNSL